MNDATAPSRINRLAMPVSMSQYGAGQRLSSWSVQPSELAKLGLLLVQFLARKQPCSAGDQVVPASSRIPVVGRVLDDRAVQQLLLHGHNATG